MAKRRLTEADIQRILAEYDGWRKFDAGSETAEELAERLGISKQTLYRHVRERRTNRRPAEGPSEDGHPAGLEPVVRYLTEELVTARTRITELERRLAERPPASA